MSDEYAAVKALYESSSPFSPDLSPQFHTSIGFALLACAFGIGFLFTTLPAKGVPTTELLPAAMASILTGFGVVFLFHAAGVHV
ncbi:hypothetical protein O181_012173 [Austropuccinia psidii MF-1]|uniref:Dolichyl-diphosphooligosaccharide-protein glycosyltransferase subunit OST5 n=1 Tax=Austropuccinia psidii MF-1 TaxID=1389203 RepID=A0A9Q3BWA4_9BASI|nr:hypothetical protein [Austropuccinia psidii MF-1]